MRGEVVTILHARTVTDPYSDAPVEDWTAPPDEVDVMTLAPPEPRPASTSDEPLQDARNSVTSGFTLYLPLSTYVTRKDRVRVRGEVYPVQGVPALWYARGGAAGGLVVQAYSTEG